MSRRAKVAANSPYNTGDADARTFPATDGEVLTAADFIALADDLQAIVDRLGSAGSSEGFLDISDVDLYNIVNVATPVTPDFAAATVRWAKTGKIVEAWLYFEMNSSMTLTQFILDQAAVVALGLPAPDPDIYFLADAFIFQDTEYTQRLWSVDGLIIQPSGATVLGGGDVMRVHVSYKTA